jgi:hypothetical protein
VIHLAHVILLALLVDAKLWAKPSPRHSGDLSLLGSKCLVRIDDLCLLRINKWGLKVLVWIDDLSLPMNG